MTAPVPAPILSQHVTSGGARIYTLTIRAFPHLPVNVFLVVLGDSQQPSYTALVDVGGSSGGSTHGLVAALDAVREEYGERWSWETLSRIVITHPHPDHVAGLPFVRTLTEAPVAAFNEAVPVIQNPQARTDAHLARVDAHLIYAGIDGEYAARMRRRAGNLMLPAGVPVQTPLNDGDVLDGLFKVIYTPGHDGAQICLQLHDVLFSADHLLPRNSPPLMPLRWQAGAGLANYLASLDKIEALEGVNLALGGHDDPMPGWRSRIVFLRQRYADKLQGVLDAAHEPKTIFELTHAVNPRLKPVQALLLLDQTGALVEYLAGQGRMTETLNEGGTASFQTVR